MELGPNGCIGVLKESQGSPQTRTDSPLPIAQLSPFRSKSLPARILRHPCEAVKGAEQSRKVEFLAYLPNKTRDNSDCGSVRILHPAPDKNLVVQLCDFCRSLSTMDAKISFFLRLKFSGKPRYFPMPPSAEISIVSLTR